MDRELLSAGLAGELSGKFGSLTTREAVEIADYIVIKEGYVKAPKNDLLPLDEEELDNIITDIYKTNDVWYKGEVDICKLRNAITEAICSKYGSIGNKLMPLQQGTVFEYLTEVMGNETPFDIRKGLADGISARFGSSGKRPLDKISLGDFIFDIKSKKKIDCYELSEAICKEFSTAEVSEEQLVKVIQDTKKIGMVTHYTIEYEWALKIAKAIKRELEGK